MPRRSKPSKFKKFHFGNPTFLVWKNREAVDRGREVAHKKLSNQSKIYWANKRLEERYKSTR